MLFYLTPPTHGKDTQGAPRIEGARISYAYSHEEACQSVGG
jgi:hypothetical protein